MQAFDEVPTAMNQVSQCPLGLGDILVVGSPECIGQIRFPPFYKSGLLAEGVGRQESFAQLLFGGRVNPSRRSKYLLYPAKPIYVICRDFVLVRFGPLAAEAENFGAPLILSSLGRQLPTLPPPGRTSIAPN